MVLRVSAASSKEVRALISALKLVEPNVSKEIRARTKVAVTDISREELLSHATTRLQVRGIVDTTRVTVTNQNIQVKAGAVKGRFRNGLDPRKSIRSLEFGGGDKRTTYTRRSKNGGSHKVTRLTLRQFGPRVRSGKTFFPAVKDMAPRAVSHFIQTALRTIHETVERR